jgi:hypothetical protein
MALHHFLQVLSLPVQRLMLSDHKQRRYNIRFTSIVKFFLIDDGINGNRSFSNLAVTNDQFRCPRPIGIMASIALIPVCNGSVTGCLKITPGALRSNGISYLAP